MSSSARARSRRARGGAVALLVMAALGLGLSMPAPAVANTPGRPAKKGKTTTAPAPPLLPGAPQQIGELAPAQAGANQKAAESTDESALAINDPFCVPGLSAQQEQNCRVSGSVAEPYPLSNYGIDYANPPTGISQLSPGDWFSTETGWAGSVVWDIWLYAIRGVLSLLNWAFTLRLVHDAMAEVKQALGVMHNQVFGVSWLQAALAVAGLWALWNGLVKRKTIETVAGLVTTVAFMLVALVLIAEPDATVGRASSWADQASLTALSGASRANVAQPAQGFAAAEGNLFTALVLRPWCALEFGSVNYCTAPRGSTTVADIWLAFGPMGPGRQGLYNLATTGSIKQYGGLFGSLAKAVGLVSTPPVITVGQACGSAPNGQQCQALKDAEALNCWGAWASPTCAFSKAQSGNVAMQAGGDALSRTVMLFLISVGLLGAICLLLYLAVHLVFAAIMTLLLLLAAPVMLLVAAFGESGRTTFVAWAKRLLGALITKLVFAVLLALVVLMAAAINGLQMGWFSVWMLNIVFWWGALIKRKQLIGFLTLDKRAGDAGLAVAGDGTQNPFRLMNLYYGWRMLQAGGHLARGIGRGATALPRAAGGRAHDRRVAEARALRAEDPQVADAQARVAIGARDKDLLENARETIGQRGTDEREMKRLSAVRRGIDDQLKQSSPKQGRATLSARRKAVTQQIGHLQSALDAGDAGFRNATATATRLGGGERAIDERESRGWQEQRRLDLQDGFPDRAAEPERFDRFLHAAGVSGRDYLRANAPDRQGYEERAREAAHKHARVFERIDDPRAKAGLPVPRGEGKQRWQELELAGREGPARVRAYDELQADRAEKRQQRRHPGRARSRRGTGMRG